MKNEAYRFRARGSVLAPAIPPRGAMVKHVRVRFYDPAGSPGSRAGAALVAGILALVSVAVLPFASGSPVGPPFLGVAAAPLYTLLASPRGARRWGGASVAGGRGVP